MKNIVLPVFISMLFCTILGVTFSYFLEISYAAGIYFCALILWSLDYKSDFEMFGNNEYGEGVKKPKKVIAIRVVLWVMFLISVLFLN
ncbi:hypothetical protein [Shewanella goraebulensis]|uniref:hypothetical protein n=1 Tax=Shewanella goraebulensis TaxID=3050637 RepID=UPI00254D1692|nr:hypothetical protein [Shewanella goraebulensis]